MICQNKECRVISFDPYWTKMKWDENCLVCKKLGHKTKGSR